MAEINGKYEEINDVNLLDYLIKNKYREYIFNKKMRRYYGHSNFCESTKRIRFISN